MKNTRLFESFLLSSIHSVIDVSKIIFDKFILIQENIVEGSKLGIDTFSLSTYRILSLFYDRGFDF